MLPVHDYRVTMFFILITSSTTSGRLIANNDVYYYRHRLFLKFKENVQVQTSKVSKPKTYYPSHLTVNLFLATFCAR